MSIEGVTRELLVRYLDGWVPVALHARRATFAQAWPETADVGWAESVVRVFAEFADQMGRRQVTLVFLAPKLADIGRRLRALQTELDTPAGLAVHAVAGDAARLAAALTAAQSSGAPLLACVDGGETDLAAVVKAGKPTEILVVDTPDGADHAAELRAAGLPLACRVDFVAGSEVRRLAFGTGLGARLEAFKDALWQLDEYAGVAIRDPNDAEGKLLDIALAPPLGPLRRELTAHLRSAGPRTLAQLRQFALADTVYRGSDATKAVTAMLASGALARSPEAGRLGGDTVVRLPR